jgi:glycosyl transferase family 87
MVIPALLAAPALLILAVATLYPTDQLFPNQGDLNLYLEKARAVASGQVPYRDFPFEYPPGGLLPMVLPYLAWPFGPVDLAAYKLLFGAWEAGLLAVLAAVLAAVVRLGGDAEADVEPEAATRLRRVAVRLFVLSVGAALAIAFRFDLFPALLMAVALWAALAGRPGAAGLALGLGVLAKLFPVAILPAIAIPWLVPFNPRGLARLVASLGATVAAGLAPFLFLAGSESTLQFLRYNAERGLEVESIGGGLAVLGGLLTGNPIVYNYRFSSVNADGPVAEAWLTQLPVMTVVGFGILAWLAWRRIRAERDAFGAVRQSTVVTLATISIVMLLASAKVYSIQYVVWLVPLFALLAGRQFWLGAVIVALTIPIHPLLFADLVKQEALPILVLNLRNALLVGLLAWKLWEVARPAGLEPTTFRSAT